MKTQKTTKPTKHAEFTLVVDFKPEFFRLNPDTGEIITRWTYRDDIEAEKFSRNHNGLKLSEKLESLKIILKNEMYRYKKARLYANYRPQPLLAEFDADGKIIYPIVPGEREEVRNWMQ